MTRNHVSQSVSDFSSVIARIPKNTQVVYIPWQLAPQAQSFYQQLRAAGRSAILFGSDGLYAPGTFEAKGAYVSAFPFDPKSPVIKAFARAHGGSTEAFGLPSYTSVWANATAINRACKKGHGKTTRKAVRKALLKLKLTSTGRAEPHEKETFSVSMEEGGKRRILSLTTALPFGEVTLTLDR